MNLLAGNQRIRPFWRLPLMILTGLICISDTENYGLFICYIIPFKNHIAIYDESLLINKNNSELNK